jgi:aryl-alcohol dehydrogenase-like predicted oxidoreductase
MIKKRKLGKTDINVSEICLGTMTWGEQNTEKDGHEQMDYALDMGINFFDTAEMYAVPPSHCSLTSFPTIYICFP